MTLEENIRQLRESLIVTSAQTLRHETFLKEHEEWLRDHEKALRAHLEAVKLHDREMKEMRERDRVIDARIESLVSAIGELIRGGSGPR